MILLNLLVKERFQSHWRAVAFLQNSLSVFSRSTFVVFFHLLTLSNLFSQTQIIRGGFYFFDVRQSVVPWSVQDYGDGI